MCKQESPYCIIRLESIDSTNSYAKRLLTAATATDVNPAECDGTNSPLALPFVVVSETQTAGRGRIGRTFISPKGSGIYMSIVFPAASSTVPLSLVTPAAAVATCRSIKKVCGVSPLIKWVNDIYLDNKKVCGILTELHTMDNTPALIIGIGVNCFPGSFPDDVADIAGCISDDSHSFDKETLMCEIAASVIDILSSEAEFLSEYRDLCFILGKNIEVTSLASNEKYKATAVDIDRDGSLIVERINNSGIAETLRLISAEVSLHT